MAKYHNQSTLSDLFDYANLRIAPREDPINLIKSITNHAPTLPPTPTSVANSATIPNPILQQHFGKNYQQVVSDNASPVLPESLGLFSNVHHVCIIVHKESLEPSEPGAIAEVELKKASLFGEWDHEDLRKAQSYQFENQYSVPGGNGPIVSGTIMNDQYILTCAHLIDSVILFFGLDSVHSAVKYICDNYVAIQGYYLLGSNTFAAQTKYDIKAVPYIDHFAVPDRHYFSDIAVLEYKNGTKSPFFPKIADEPIPDGREVYCLGFGYGQPMKISLNGHTYMSQTASSRCKLIIRPGNSGSPVFDAATHEMVGIIHGTYPEISNFSVIHLDYRPWQDLTGYDGAIFTKLWRNNDTPNTKSLYNLI